MTFDSHCDLGAPKGLERNEVRRLLREVELREDEHWDQTEDDDPYEYSYLEGRWERGSHRKWVAVLEFVICANSFHYFSAPEQSLQEMRRVFQPDGSRILVDWCDDYLTCKACSVWLRWIDPAFHRTYSLRSFRSLATQAGSRVNDADRFRVGWLCGTMRLVCRRAD